MISTDGTIFTMAETNTETTSALFSQLAGLLSVGKREDGKYHLSDLCQSKNINPLARHKPFRYPAWNFASAEERAQIRGSRATGENSTSPNNGFGPTPQIYVANSDIVHGVYEYKRPRGGEEEPNRLRDFDGYNHNAGSPLQIQFETEAGKDDINYVIVNVQHTSGTGGKKDDCLLLHELLDSNNMERYFALLITGGGYSGLMPTKYKPYDMKDDKSYTFTIVFHEDSNKLSSYSAETNPTVGKDINNVPEGTEMTIALVLSNTGYTGESLPANGYFGSLELVENSDRTKIKLLSSKTLAGLTYEYKPTSWGSFESISSPNSSKAYGWKNVSELLTIHTPSKGNNTFVTARVTIGGYIGDVYDERNNIVAGPSANGPLTYDVGIQTSKYEYSSYGPISNGTFTTTLFDDSKLYKYKFTMAYPQTQIYLPVTISFIRGTGSNPIEEITVFNETLQFTVS